MTRIKHLITLIIFCLSIQGPVWPQDVTKKRILVASPVRQKPAILKEFLDSLRRLEKTSYTLDYFFIDDNTQDESHELLLQFRKSPPDPQAKVEIGLVKGELPGSFVCNETTHYWTENLIWKVAAFKDVQIKYAREKGYDYLFLIDSDIVLHPATIEQLMKAKKEIISNIFWTKWNPDTIAVPQVWLTDQYTQFHRELTETVSPEEMTKRQQVFLDKLLKPGTYEIGGLGACTLISKLALEKGISFSRIKNITLWGEDRHFCVRASALGIDLFVDTHFPAYHIYRTSDLAGVAGFIDSCKQNLQQVAEKTHRLTLSMIVKNEGARYLRRVLEDAKQYITDAVIIDDASTDNTIALCEEVLKGIPLRIVRNTESKFSNEVTLRKQQWDETIKTNPEWILNLDADEIFEAKFKDEVQKLLTANDVDVYYFRLYDFWDEEHYREDGEWQAHRIFRPFLVRYKPGIVCTWQETPQHCGRFPMTIYGLSMKSSELRLKHYGWAKPEDRSLKYARYTQLDPEAKYGVKAQYDSILETNPRLVKWIE